VWSGQRTTQGRHLNQGDTELKSIRSKWSLVLLAAAALACLVGPANASANGLQIKQNPTGPPSFTAESYPTTYYNYLTANVLAIPSGKVTCENHTSRVGPGGEMASASSQYGVKPVYSGCAAFGRSAEVKMNACAYYYRALSGEGFTANVLVELVCSEGSQMEIAVKTGTLVSCTIVVKPQVLSANQVYWNAEKSIKALPTGESAVSYSISGWDCPVHGSYTDATLTGYRGETTAL
jgi:hypothetical protein